MQIAIARETGLNAYRENSLLNDRGEKIKCGSVILRCKSSIYLPTFSSSGGSSPEIYRPRRPFYSRRGRLTRLAMVLQVTATGATNANEREANVHLFWLQNKERMDETKHYKNRSNRRKAENEG